MRFLLVVTLFLVVAAPHLVIISSPTQTRPDATLQPPSAQHWLGTDHLGRDMWSRLVYGGQRTLLISTSGWVIAVCLGGVTGILAAMGGRILGELANAALFLFLALPTLLTSLLLLTFLGRGAAQLAIATGFALFALLGVVIRSECRWLLKQDFVEASVALGSGRWGITKRHILPHVREVVLAYGGVLYGYVLVTSAGLGFLGLGGDPSYPEWGVMLAEARYSVRYAPHVALVTGMALTVLVFSVNRLSTQALRRLTK